MQSVIELIDKILSLTVAHPKACQISVRQLLATREGMKKAVVLFDSIGLEYSKQLFDRITSPQWRSIKELSHERSTSSNPESEAKLLLEIYTNLLIESLASDSPEDLDDPFSFLKELNNYELSSILTKEDPTQIAFISLHWNPEEMSHLLACLAPPIRRQVILNILRLDRIPEEALERAAASFATLIKRRFQGLFDDTEFEFDTFEDCESVQSIMANIDIEEEQKMLDFIKGRATSIKLQFKDFKDT
jgi:flagellar motor switch protein FliG